MADQKDSQATPNGLLRQLLQIANGQHNKLSRLVPPLLLVLDALLCIVIIIRVPYTEIDWTAYMEQVSQFLAGERDYTKIKGATGPLVYPAAHVYTYSGLYLLTDEGRNIFLAQCIFAGLYLGTLALVMACYAQAKAPPYLFPLLILSKRLHSIYMLRCFNDGVATLFLWLAIFCFQRRNWALGSVFYSWGVGVKMSLLLSLPGVAVVLFLGRGLMGSLRQAWIMIQMQILLGVPFWSRNGYGYLGRAFELSRQFLFKWTVNWRFVGETAFLSKRFSMALLMGHVATLAVFVVSRWLKPTQKPVTALIASFLKAQSPFTALEEIQVSGYITAKYVTTTILTANIIGLLFARSLHYQFYAYLAWSTPYLLWRSRLPWPVIYLVFFVQEFAWNVFPSTDQSSGIVVGVLAFTVGAVWWGTANDQLEVAPLPRPRGAQKPASKAQ